MKRQIITTVCISLLLPIVALATTEENSAKTFANIPFLSGNLTTQGFVTALYQMAIGLAAIAVVIRIIIAGSTLMLSSVVPSRSQATEDIKSALLGLVIILATVLILGTINPKLVGLNVLNGGSSVNLNNNQTDTNTVDDQVNFKPGDTHSKYDIDRRCDDNSSWWSTNPTASCVDEAETQLKNSCRHNGGSFEYESSNNRYLCK